MDQQYRMSSVSCDDEVWDHSFTSDEKDNLISISNVRYFEKVNITLHMTRDIPKLHPQKNNIQKKLNKSSILISGRDSSATSAERFTNENFNQAIL